MKTSVRTQTSRISGPRTETEGAVNTGRCKSPRTLLTSAVECGQSQRFTGNKINGWWDFAVENDTYIEQEKTLTLFKSQKSAEQTKGRNGFRFRFSTSEAPPTVRKVYLLTRFISAKLQD